MWQVFWLMVERWIFLSLCFHTHKVWVGCAKTVFACACVFKCICRAAVCFGEGLMIHLWPSTMWHSKDWANIVLIISSKCMCLLHFSVRLGVFLSSWGCLVSLFNGLWVSLKKPKKSPRFLHDCQLPIVKDDGAAKILESIFILIISAHNHQNLPVNKFWFINLKITTILLNTNEYSSEQVYLNCNCYFLFKGKHHVGWKGSQAIVIFGVGALRDNKYAIMSRMRHNSRH